MNHHATPTTSIVLDAIVEHACPVWCQVPAREHLELLPHTEGVLIHRAELACEGAPFAVDIAVCTTVDGALVDEGEPQVFVTHPDSSSPAAVFLAFADAVSTAATQLQAYVTSRRAQAAA